MKKLFTKNEYSNCINKSTLKKYLQLTFNYIPRYY